MPPAYKRCVKHVEAKGHSTSSAHAICTSVDAGGIAAARAKERAATRKKQGKRGS
jgi:hypothetical protein